mmetsp:Transcript_43811/g.89504  ORF Transcript_43811/g.89504 Transcript_43811/m.89504 type:complete len:80 (+) Transcript_43811:507-746(+)
MRATTPRACTIQPDEEAGTLALEGPACSAVAVCSASAALAYAQLEGPHGPGSSKHRQGHLAKARGRPSSAHLGKGHTKR